MDSFDVVKLITALNRIADKVEAGSVRSADKLEELTEKLGDLIDELRDLRAEITAVGDLLVAITPIGRAHKE